MVLQIRPAWRSRRGRRGVRWWRSSRKLLLRRSLLTASPRWETRTVNRTWPGTCHVMENRVLKPNIWTLKLCHQTFVWVGRSVNLLTLCFLPAGQHAPRPPGPDLWAHHPVSLPLETGAAEFSLRYWNLSYIFRISKEDFYYLVQHICEYAKRYFSWLKLTKTIMGKNNNWHCIVHLSN